MSVILLLVVSAVFLLAAATIRKTTSQVSRDQRLKPLPGPRSVPYLGCMPFVLREAVSFLPNYEKMRLLSKKYANEHGVFAAQAGAQFCNNMETAKEIMNSEDWINRLNDHPSFYERSFNQQIGLVLGNGEGWKEVRKFTIKNLRQFGFGKAMTMESSLCLELETILDKMKSKIGENNGIVDMHLFFNVSVLNLLWLLMVGERFSHHDQKLCKLLKFVDKVSKSQPQGVTPVFAFPFLRYIPRATEHDMIVELHRQVQDMFRGIVRKRLEDGRFMDDPANFIDVFLQQIHNSNSSDAKNQVFTEEQLLMVCVDLFFTGSDSSSTTLEFAIMYLVLNPHVQEKVFEEIKNVVGTERPPHMDDRMRMPYTEATIMEVLRYSSILPVTARTSVVDVNLRGYFVPKGTLAGINLHAMHFSESTWGDPTVFRPERFLNENNEIINADKIMPFGFGKRVCLGETMARTTVFTFFTGVLQKYKFSASAKHGPPSPVPITGFLQYPRRYCVNVSPRANC